MRYFHSLKTWDLVATIWGQYFAESPNEYSVNSCQNGCFTVEEMSTELMSNTIRSQTNTAGLNIETLTDAELGCVLQWVRCVKCVKCVKYVKCVKCVKYVSCVKWVKCVK